MPLARDRAVADGPVILGIRPESFEDPAFAPGLPTIEVAVEVLEDLGSDAHVFFTVDARSITAEVLEAGGEAQAMIADGRRAVHGARRRADGRDASAAASGWQSIPSGSTSSIRTPARGSRRAASGAAAELAATS